VKADFLEIKQIFKWS